MPADPPADSAEPTSGVPWRAPALVFALAVLVTAMLLASVSRSIEARDRVEFEADVARTLDAVRERIDTTVTLLHGATGLFAASDGVTRGEFADYVGRLALRERYPGILGLGYSIRLAPGEVPALEERVRAQGLPGFHVWPQAPRGEYHAIVYLEPLDERNRAAMGYDMFTEPTRRAAMERARDEARPVASGKVQLVQEIDERKQAGFLIYLPFYRGGTVPATVEARRAALEGFIYAPLRVGDLLQGVRGIAPGVDYELYAGIEPNPTALMRSTAARPAAAPAFSTVRHVEVAGQPWLLRFTSTPEADGRSQRGLLPWLAVVSIAAALLLAWITLVQARARRAAEAAATQRRRNELALQQSEERARERASRLEQLYAELRDADRRKDEFLAVLAHELRNPLAPLRTSLEILRRTTEGPPAQRARDVAERQLRHMVRLVDDLLDVSRISRGKIVLRCAPVRLAAAIDAAVEMSRPLIQARGHKLQLAPVDPDLQLDADPDRLAQIFGNLLNNAANYTPPGGEIAVTVQADADWLRVAVRDSGIGIDPAQLRQVFELFAQVEHAAGGNGLGIGLSLAARLAELHGGRIEAHSAGRGLGAEFTVVLPRSGTLAQAQATAAPQGAQHGFGESGV